MKIINILVFLTVLDNLGCVNLNKHNKIMKDENASYVDSVNWDLEQLDSAYLKSTTDQDSIFLLYKLKRNSKIIDTIKYYSYFSEEVYCRINDYEFKNSRFQIIYEFLNWKISKDEGIIMPIFNKLAELPYESSYEKEDNIKYIIRHKPDNIEIIVYYDGGTSIYEVMDMNLIMRFCPN